MLSLSTEADIWRLVNSLLMSAATIALSYRMLTRWEGMGTKLRAYSWALLVLSVETETSILKDWYQENPIGFWTGLRSVGAVFILLAIFLGGNIVQAQEKPREPGEVSDLSLGIPGDVDEVPEDADEDEPTLVNEDEDLGSNPAESIETEQFGDEEPDQTPVPYEEVSNG